VINACLRILAKLLLWLRYRIRLTGIQAVRDKGRGGILFLPNHPALIDPVILLTYLFGPFQPRTLGDQDQIDRFLIRRLARRFGVRPMPDMAKYGPAVRDQVEAAIGHLIDDLKRGDNVLMYPSGHLYHTRYEDLAGSSALVTILQAAPDVRVVLVRTRGLWGSGFSWAGGAEPQVGKVLGKGARALLASGVFFAPRREVSIELVAPDDLPRSAGQQQLHAYLEDFYNADAPPNTYVPYSVWDRGGPRVMPEPARRRIAGDPGAVPTATRELVTDFLQDLGGVESFADDDRLANELGLDSLDRTDLVVWLEKEFGFPQGDSDSVQTVGDVMLAACGEGITGGAGESRPAPPRWFADAGSVRLTVPEGETICEVFLAQARRHTGQVVLADPTAGAKTYRDAVLAVMVLRRHIARLPGRRVGIMLPASVGADLVYLATLFAGKTPVMVNWTVGPRNMQHALEVTGVRAVLTAGALVEALAAKGVEFGPVAERFIRLEELRKRITFAQKLGAWLRSRLSWRSLAKVRPTDVAAVLFTSGSESLPKAVPLTHANLLTNVRDVAAAVELYPSDRLIGFLPPFHSFGLTAGPLVALCLALPIVHHAIPTDAKLLARLIEAYGATILIGTPTFLGGILRVAAREQLATLRLAVTGAEKCGRRVYEALARQCPGAKVLEGYGVTECSPIISLNDYDRPQAGTIGKVLGSLEHVLVDPDSGRRVGPGETGVLLVRGPSVFGGYLDYDGPSPFVEHDGARWYRTGDLVRADAEGVLTFAGRLKRFIKLGGEMISLPAVEAVLESHYAADSDEGPVLAVEATGDEDHPEIMLFAARDLDRQTVNAQIRSAGLSALHNIRRVVRLEAIPVLGTGKTDYRELKRILAGG